MDRTVLFDRVRAAPFGGSLSQGQVDGIEAILAAADRHGMKDVRHVAYCLATAFHETGPADRPGHMQPIKEYGGSSYFTKMYDINGTRPSVAKTLGNTLPGDGARFCGRGYVQLTGRSNYVRAGREIGVDLVASPDLALSPGYAAEIMFAGMTEGWFTGKKLADYFSASKDDAVNARRIINGTDKASAIAGYHASFLAALKASGWGAAPIPSQPVPQTAPTPAPTPPVKAGSFWSALLSILAAIFKRNAK